MEESEFSQNPPAPKWPSNLNKGLRFLAFYFCSGLPVLGFLALNYNFLLPDQVSPQLVSVLALAWWVLCWLSLGILEVVWPVLILVFFKLEKERDPKIIIQIGERFRKYDLLTPQIWILQERVPFWTHRLIGFSRLPSPFGAVLLMTQEMSESWDSNDYLNWMSRMACEAKNFRWSHGGYVLVTVTSTLAVLGLASPFEQIPNWIQSLLLSILGFAAFFWQDSKRRQRIDEKTMRDFQIPGIEYLKSAQHWNPKFELKTFADFDDLGDPPALPVKFWDYANIGALASVLFAIILGAALGPIPNYDGNQQLASGKKNAVKTSPKPLEKQTEATPPQALSADLDPKLNAVSKAVLSGDMRGFVRSLRLIPNIHSGDVATQGATPLLLALKKSDLEFVFLILALGGDPATEVDDKGEGAVFYALSSEHPKETLQYVLLTHVNAGQTNKAGESPLQRAEKIGNPELVSLLDSKIKNDRVPANQTPEKAGDLHENQQSSKLRKDPF